MYILILASAPGIAEKIQTALGSTAERYAVAATWSDVTSHLIEKDCPNLVLVERAALNQMELATLLKLAEPNHWPPLLLVDPSAAGARNAIEVAQRLVQPLPQYYQIGDLRLDTHRKRAGLGGRWVTLPPIQYRLLLKLAQHAGEVIDCQELLRTVWGYDAAEIEARALVKVHIRQIRRRLGLDPGEHNYIHSVRGEGYYFEA